MTSVDEIWLKLEVHRKRLAKHTLSDLLSMDRERFTRLSTQLDDLLFDYSRERLDSAVLEDLIELARATGVEDKREAMAIGDKINVTEKRAVLHIALRDSVSNNICDEQGSVKKAVDSMRKRCLKFATAVRTGEFRSFSGHKFTDVVNIGIGGSDLGPAMVTQALAPWHDGPKLHYVSNVDGAHILETLENLDPKTTLLIIASKTFTTSETMLNFKTALAWLNKSLGENAGHQLVAISTNLEATRAYGIDDERVFGFWDWVGGRYSVWSSIGLSIAIAIGSDNFDLFLSGARQMDKHFISTPLEDNLPVIAALVGIWRRNILKYPTVAMIPYDQHLSRLPAYIQQLDMESNGKRVNLEGEAVGRGTGPVIWGEPGTNAQHSFFQLIHQGTDVIPVDFLIAAKSSVHSKVGEPDKHQDALICNALAQAQALAFGESEDIVRREMVRAGVEDDDIDRLAPHKVFPGNRPSSMYVFEKLTPETLGKLVALFEHKIFVQGVVWNINSFDQWGVELGKKLAKELESVFEKRIYPSNIDKSTKGLMEHIHLLR